MKQKKLKLTPEEELLILEKRRQKELEEERDRPKKMGFFKEDKYLYYTSRIESEGDYSELITKSKKDALVKKFLDNFVLIKAGTKFVCFIDDGIEFWFDDVGIGIEEEDADWAKENLTNIQDIK
jgi:hypothetical protein